MRALPGARIAYVLPEGRECSRIQLTDAQAHCATHAGKFVCHPQPDIIFESYRKCRTKWKKNLENDTAAGFIIWWFMRMMGSKN